jgi:ubiquinone/menaquinone biosynthesis C-methylase UbiE
MQTHPPPHTDRRRAESFGAAAERYDRYRPRYPRTLIAGIVPRNGIRALDVGAGTGIASAQLAKAGAHVLAVEPDARMARVAAAKGISVEQATFEEWQPAGRSFHLVVFASSFHWMRPRVALNKVATILSPGGRLALLSNRIVPVAPTRAELNAVSAELLDVTGRASVKPGEELTALIARCGYSIERRRVVQRLHYTTEDFVNLLFTHSNRLILDPIAGAELRSRLERRIGTAGVDAESHATAVICARTVSQTLD